MSKRTKKYFQPSLFIVGAVLFFTAVYSLYPVFASPLYNPGDTLDPTCAPGDTDCTVSAPLVTNMSTTTNVVMSTYALSFNTSTLYIDPTNNRIGINTTSPLSALDVYGNIIISTSSGYLSFGTTVGTSGYGIRDNNGTLQLKNSGDSWIDMVTSTALSADSVGATELASTTVTAGSYGSASQAMILSVDADGRITSASTSSISIAGSQITSGLVSSTYGGTNQDTSAWTGFLKVNSGVWSTSTVSLTADTSGILPIASGGTGASAFTNGSLVFSNGSILTQDNSNLFWDNSNDYLGVGTSTPSTTLHVVADENQFIIGYDTTVYTTFSIDDSGTLNITPTGGAESMVGVGGTFFVEEGYVQLYGNSTGEYLNIYNYDDDNYYTSLTIGSDGALTIDSTGNATTTIAQGLTVEGNLAVNTNTIYVDANTSMVGIGTSAPEVGLHVGTSNSTHGLIAVNDAIVSGNLEIDGFTYLDNDLIVDTNTLYVDSFSNFVGIGTTTPGKKLHIYATDNSSILKIERDNINPAYLEFSLSNGRTYIKSYSPWGMNFYDSYNNIYTGQMREGKWIFGESSGFPDIPASSVAITGNLAVGSSYDTLSAPSNGLIIEGNVGIGTSTPGARLHALSTTEQLRLGYNAGSYTSFTVANDGGLTITPSNNATTTISNGLVVNTNSLVVDKSTGYVGIGTMSPGYKFSVASTDGSDQIGIFHSNTNAYIKWNDGVLVLGSDEGTDRDSYVDIEGKGTGYGILRVKDQDESEFIEISAYNGKARIKAEGITPLGLTLNSGGDSDIFMFESSPEGETKELFIYGRRTGDSLRSLQIGVGVDFADTASFDGVSNYYFDGNIGIGTTTPSYKFSVASTDGSDQVGIYHTGYNASMKWTDGALILSTDEGTDYNSTVDIDGKGTGFGILRTKDEDSAEYTEIFASNGKAYMRANGPTPLGLSFNNAGASDIFMFENSGVGETKELNIYGYRTGDTSRSLQIGVGVDFADTASFNGVSNYYFDGNIGIGTSTPGAKLHALSTTEQLRLGYDASNYVSFTVSSTGQLDILSSGGIVKIGDAGNTSQSLVANDDLFISGKLEVDGIAYFDATSTFGGNLTTSANALVLMSASNTIQMAYDSSNYTQWTIGSDGQLSIASGQPTTTFSNNVVIDNLYSGMLSMPQDGGQVDVMDIPVSLSAVTSSVQGYNFLVDGLLAMSIYGSASSGTVSNIGVSIGTGTPASMTSSEGDLYVTGGIEIDGIAYFDATSTFGGNLTTSANALVLTSASSTMQMAYDSSNYTQWTMGSDGQLSIASGQPTTTFSNTVVIDNLYSGMLSLPQNGGQVNIMDIPVSSSATASSTQGYNFLVDGLPAMSIYGLASAGTVSNIGVSIGTVNTSSYRLYVQATDSSTPGIGVDGYIKATGYITESTSTADIAETYPIDSSCEDDNSCPIAGNTVCSVETDTGDFIIEKCKANYADNSLGVITSDPGFVLGGFDYRKGLTPSTYRVVALSGRVPVKVSDRNGSIKAGDYLTSSDISGIAVKATSPGKVLGVALQSQTSPTGTVMMFINLHWNPGNLNFVSDQLPTEYGLLDQFTMAVKNSLRKMGLVIEKGIAKVKELRTDKLCVGETCINESQLQQMLNNSGTSGSSPTVTTPVVEPPVVEPPVVEPPVVEPPVVEPPVVEPPVVEPPVVEPPVVEPPVVETT